MTIIFDNMRRAKKCRQPAIEGAPDFGSDPACWLFLSQMVQLFVFNPQQVPAKKEKHVASITPFEADYGKNGHPKAAQEEACKTLQVEVDRTDGAMPICIYWKKGTCHKSDKECKFTHSFVKKKQKPICHAWRQGMCRFKDCIFSHDHERRLAVAFCLPAGVFHFAV